MNRLFQYFGDFLACGLPDCLDCLALVTKHDLLLAFALDIDHLLDANRSIFALFPAFGFHGR